MLDSKKVKLACTVKIIGEAAHKLRGKISLRKVSRIIDEEGAHRIFIRAVPCVVHHESHYDIGDNCVFRVVRAVFYDLIQRKMVHALVPVEACEALSHDEMLSIRSAWGKVKQGIVPEFSDIPRKMLVID